MTEQLTSWLQLGVGGLMLGALFLGYRRLWVFGWVYQAMMDEFNARIGRLEKERDEWKHMALHSLQLQSKLTEVAERAASE